MSQKRILICTVILMLVAGLSWYGWYQRKSVENPDVVPVVQFPYLTKEQLAILPEHFSRFLILGTNIQNIRYSLEPGTSSVQQLQKITFTSDGSAKEILSTYKTFFGQISSWRIASEKDNQLMLTDTGGARIIINTSERGAGVIVGVFYFSSVRK